MMSNELRIHGGTAATAMDVQKGPKRLKITLDHYLDFFHSAHNLSVNHLRQIILMHGFKWMNQVSKEGRTEAVRSIELTELTRSTITTGNAAQNGSSRACITLAEAIKDLSLLQWQECCVTSLQTLNSTFASPTKKKSKSKKPKSSSCSSSKKTTNSSASTDLMTAASAVTNHSDSNQQQQLEIEPPRLMLCDVDPGAVSSALVVLPAKRKKKGLH